MPKRRNTCPICGTVVEEPYKTWQLYSPLPDSKGRITITIMGMFQCHNCGHKWRGVVSKIKVGGEDVEIEGKSISKSETEKKPTRREGEIIEIDISNIDEEEF
ncbi:MAG TPA: chromatin protein Cren7 [Desulfurococcales archaeon]|nr:chromatin protein Cren7 [Desulfurococcales archaeon]